MDSDTDTDTVAWGEEGDVEEYGEAEVEACYLSMDVLGLMLSTCSQRGQVRSTEGRVYHSNGSDRDPVGSEEKDVGSTE
jgi:hypothetical protein